MAPFQCSIGMYLYPNHKYVYPTHKSCHMGGQYTLNRQAINPLRDNNLD